MYTTYTTYTTYIPYTIYTPYTIHLYSIHAIDAVVGQLVRVNGYGDPNPDPQLKSKTAQEVWKRGEEMCIGVIVVYSGI